MNRRQFFDQRAARWDGRPDRRFDTLLAARVLPLFNLKKNRPVLDVGCGTGVLLPHLRALAGPRSSITGVDFSGGMLRRAREIHGSSFRFVRATAHDMPFQTAAFHTVVSLNAFSHFPDKPAALTEMRRVLADGGKLIIAHTDSRRAVNARHKKIGGPIAGDSIPPDDALRAILRKAGFVRVKLLDAADIHVVEAFKPRVSETAPVVRTSARRVACAQCCRCGGCAGVLL